MEENVIGMPDSFFERLNKKNGFADDTTAAPVDSGTTPVATDKTIPSGMPDSFFEKLNSQQHYADTNNWAENYKRYIPQAEENPSAWDNIKNNFFAIKDASEASMYGGLELMSRQGEKSGNANFANFIKAAGMYYGADPNWLVKNMQENEAQSQEELKRVWLDPKMGQFNATDMFADPKSFFQTQLPQMLGGSATLMAAGMGIAKGAQTGVMALGAAGAPFTFGGSAVAAGFIGGAVASAISRPIESLMEGYGAFDEAYSELAKKYPNATHQQLTDMAMPVFNKTFDENMQLQVLDAVQLGLSIIPVTAWGKGALSGTGAIGRMARRADMMRQRYNVAAHIGETAFQMGTEGWEEGRQMQITNEAINKYVGTDKPTSWYDMLNTKEGQSAVSGGAFMGGMMESPGILKLAYNKLTGVGDDIKTKPYEDIKQKQTALFYGNIAKSVNEGTTNEMMQAINKFGRSGVLATVETDDADSRNKSSIAEAKRLGDEVAEQVGVFSRMKEQYPDVSEKGLVRMFQNNALIRNNANALKTLSEDNVTDAPIIQRINAQNEALNKENNDIIAGKDVWETPSHEDPFADPEKDKEADIPFDSVEEVEAARLKEIEALQQIPTDGMTDEQMYQRAESLAEINSRYEDLKNRLTEKINDAKGHYENQRVLTEMLQNNIPVEGTIQKAYGMHYDFVTQDGKTVRFYNQATHDVVDDNDFNGSAFLVLRKAEQGLDGTYKDEKGNYLFRSVLGDKDHAERIEVHTTDKDGNDKYLGNVAVSNAEDYNIARDRAKAARMEKLEGEDGEGEGFSVSDEQLSGVKTTSNEQAAEAQSYGFRNAYHALNSVNKYFDADYTDYANIPKEDLALVGRIKQEEAASATTTTPPPDSPPDSPPPSEPDTPPAPPTPPPTPPPAPQSPSPATAPSGTTSSTDSGNAGYERTERSFDKVNVGDNITHNGKQGKVFAKVRPKGSLSHPVVLAKDAEGKVFRVTESEYKGTKEGDGDNVLKTNGKLVSYRNDVGKIVVDEENNVIFEGNKSSVELGETTDEEFAAKSIGDIGISYVNENSLNQAILVDNTVYVKGEEQELVRINYDKNGNVVSYTYKNSKGQERTNRNYEAALDVAIQKNNQEFDKSRKGASDEVKQRDEEHISGVVKAEYGDSIGYILETMPDEVYDTFDLMEAGVTRIEKDAVQDMVLRTLDALDNVKKKIADSGATKKEKGNALSMIEKFEKDLNKYYGKLDQQGKVSAKDVAKANTGENNKGVNTVQTAEQEAETIATAQEAQAQNPIIAENDKQQQGTESAVQQSPDATGQIEAGTGNAVQSVETNPALRAVESTAKALEGVDTFHLVENEGEWKATTKTYRGREIGNWAISNLDKKQQKEYLKIKDEADTYGTKEQAEENLKTLKDFEQKNKEAFERAKQEIDALKEAEERKAEEGKKQQKIFDQTAQELDKLSDKEFDKLVELIDEKRRQAIEQRFGDRVEKRALFRTPISEAYHKAKVDGSNPELVKAVEDLINKNESNRNTTTEVNPKAGVSSNSNEGNSALRDVEAKNERLDDWHTELKRDKNVFWHGSPSGDMRGGEYGLHIGTHEAAKQALEARIGVKADGTDWDGTEEYGKTKLAGKETLKRLDPRGFLETGFNSGKDVPEQDYFPSERKVKATFGDKSIVPETAKPNIQPVRIKGEMSNSTSKPHEDFRANGLMKGQIKRGTAKRGYYYENVGEDAGSVSAVVPNKSHLEVIESPFKEALSKPNTNETTPTKEVSTSENKIKSWIDKWEELKKENDNEQLDLFYNKVKVALNGYAQGKGVVDEFTKLKSEIEQFAKERKAKPKEQGNKERVSSNSNEGNSALRDVESKKADIERRRQEDLDNVKPVYHHTQVKPEEFNFSSFQRGSQSISQFGDGLNASSNTTSFLVNRYGKPIQGEVNDKEFVEIDANKTEKEIYEYLKSKGYKFSQPASEYTSNEKANNHPAIIELFQDFQKSNPGVKGVKVSNHIIGGQKVTPFYVIYDSKSFYGQNSLKKQINAEYDAELAALENKPAINKEQPKAGGVSSNSNEGNSALRDVESTAKALESVVPKNESFAFAISTLPIEGTINYKDIKQNDFALPFERYVNSPEKIDKEIRSAYRIYEFLKEGGKLPNNVILLDKEGKILDGNNRVKAQLALGITDFKYAVANNTIFTQTNYKTISEAYHKAKADGSNPELVKAVEDLLSKPSPPPKKTGNGEVKPEVAEAIKKEYADIEAKAKADGTWMKAPNGKKSNLNEQQWVQVRSSRFKKWFGDWQNAPKNASKVVDANGEPMVVYHGTEAEFTEFEPTKPNFYQETEGWYFFTDKKESAKTFGKNVMPVFLNIDNPTIETTGHFNTWNLYDDEGNYGFIAANTDTGNGGIANQYVVENPNQIKSATDNVGTFSGESNSIKYQIEENRDEPLASVNPALAEYIRQRMQRLFPSVALFSDKASFEAAAKKVSKGVTFSSAYIGAAIKNMVYVDAEKALQHTEIHEYAHIYWDALPADHPLKTALLDKFGGNEEAAIDAIGRAGTIIMENELDIAKSGFFEKWLKKFWAAVKGVFTSKSIEQAFAERLLTNADEVTEENITSGVVKYMKMKSSAKYSELSEKAVKGIEKIIGKKISSLTFPEYYKHISTEIKPNDFKQWKMLSPQKFLEKMYGIVSPVSTLSPSNKAVFMKQYREYLDDYNWAENNVWTRFASGSMTLTVKEIEDLYMEAYKRKSYGTKDAVNFLADLYSKAVMYKNMQQEIKGDTFNKPFAKMSFDMMSGHEITDLSGSEFVSGKYSLLSPDRVKETILQGREKLYREVQRNATIKEDALKNDFNVIWKKVKDLKSDLRKIVDKTGTYFIDRNSSAYKALRGGTAADRALADLLDMHYKYESAYGGLSMEKGKYRVPVARMDFGGLAKKFGFKEGMRRYFAKPSKYDNVIIDVRSLGLSKPLMTLKQARHEMVKGSNAIYPFQMLKLTKKVDALTKEAYKQFNSGRHANGDIVTTEDLSGSRYGVSFVKDDESSEDLKVSMMLYHYANIENESYDLLSPYSMYIQKYLGRKDKPNMLKWVKMLDDDLIKGESPTSNLGVYAKYVQALTNYTHWLQLGFNIAGMPFNAFAGFAQSVREIGFRNTLRGLRRVIGSLTVGGGAGVVNAKAISIMEKLHIVSLSKDLEMSVTSKIGKGISKIAFLPVSFVEYINHAYSFIGAMDESEWERVKALPANASAEDYTKAMGGNERIDELHTLTQKINGAYSKYSRRGINKTAEGRALMQFKNWLPDVIFAHLTVSQLNEAGEDLYGEYQSGIATSIKNTVWNKTIIPMFKDKSIAQAKKNWETLSEHEQMQVGKAMRQLVILGGMALWIASLDDRDDKELKRMLRRAMGDVTYIFDVSNMQFLFDNTVPVFGTIKNLLGLVAEVFSTATGNPSVYEKRQGSHMRGDLKLPVMIENQTPVVNKISKLVNEGD